MAESLIPLFCSALLSLHVYTGCNTTNAFKGIVKLKPLKVLDKNTEYKKIFSELENECTLAQEAKDNLEAYQ